MVAYELPMASFDRCLRCGHIEARASGDGRLTFTDAVHINQLITAAEMAEALIIVDGVVREERA